MRDFSDTPIPLATVRPRGARMIEARSPKLGRLVQHYDHASFQQWVRLEADPDVEMFCERPTRMGRDPTSPLIHFWVQRRQNREFVLLSRGEVPANLPSEHDGTPLRVVTPPELAAAAIWIGNWQRMLPVINCAGDLVTHALKKSILGFVDSSITLMGIERALATTEPMLARAAVFELLRTGALGAPSLHTERLSLHTIMEPVQ